MNIADTIDICQQITSFIFQLSSCSFGEQGYTKLKF